MSTPIVPSSSKQFGGVVSDLKASDAGIGEGYASTFGNLDYHGDVIVRGAFRESIRETGGRWPVLWQHDTTHPVGVGLEAAEDDYGLKVKWQFVMNTTAGREAWEHARAGSVKGLSIGFRIPEGGSSRNSDGTRKLTRIDLAEYSMVTFAANPLAEVERVKTDPGLQVHDEVELMKLQILAAISSPHMSAKDMASYLIVAVDRLLKGWREYADERAWDIRQEKFRHGLTQLALLGAEEELRRRS